MILVTGGTGLVGSHLLYTLLSTGENVRAIFRASSNRDAVKKVFSYYTPDYERLYTEINWVEASVNDIPALTIAFEGITHVYHAAGFISFDPKQYRTLKKVNIEGTANIVNLCLAYQIQKLCFVSSVATFGSSKNGKLIDEDCDWNPEDNNNVYAISKYGAEMEVWRGTQEGLDVIIVNPAVILGETKWDVGSGLIIKSAAKNTFFYTTGGLGIVDVKDVIRAMIGLMNSDYKNKRYALVGKNISYYNLIKSLSVNFNSRPPRRLAPKWALSFFRKIDWCSSILFGTKRRLFKTTVNSLCTISHYDASKIERDLSFQFTPIEETIERVVKNYRLKF